MTSWAFLPKVPRGVIAGAYDTRGGERVWLVAWDGHDKPPPFDVDAEEDFVVGQRVRVVGGRLERDR